MSTLACDAYSYKKLIEKGSHALINKQRDDAFHFLTSACLDSQPTRALETIEQCYRLNPTEKELLDNDRQNAAYCTKLPPFIYEILKQITRDSCRPKRI